MKAKRHGSVVMQQKYLERMAWFATHELQGTLQNSTRVSKRIASPFPILSLPTIVFIFHNHYVQDLIQFRHIFRPLPCSKSQTTSIVSKFNTTDNKIHMQDQNNCKITLNEKKFKK